MIGTYSIKLFYFYFYFCWEGKRDTHSTSFLAGSSINRPIECQADRLSIAGDREEGEGEGEGESSDEKREALIDLCNRLLDLRSRADPPTDKKSDCC